MNDLVIMHDQQAVITSLKVAESFSKAHRNVLASIKKLTAEFSAVKNMFAESTYVNKRGQEQPMYYMNRDGFTVLAMGFTGEAALQFKLMYIDAFNKMENALKKVAKPDSYMIEDPVKRAERWIEEAKERQELEHKNEKLQDKIDKDADDVVFARAIRYSHHAIPIRELADILTQNGFTIGQNQLYKLLRDEKYLSKQKDFWNLPMSSKVKAGYFRVIHKVTRDGRPYRKTLVTPEGQKHLINKALKGKFDDNYQKVIVSTLGI